jgi:uncharacterized protein
MTDNNDQYELAIRYEHGKDGAVNLRMAAKHYRLAAEGGHLDAQLTMAKLCLIGKGVQQDFEEAFDWYLRAAERGHPTALFNVGEMLAYGTGVPQNKQQSAEWFKKAMAAGHPDAAKRLSEL